VVETSDAAQAADAVAGLNGRRLNDNWPRKMANPAFPRTAKLYHRLGDKITGDAVERSGVE